MTTPNLEAASVISGNKLSGAVFSDCERYRYALWRLWDQLTDEPVFMAFIGLNPSTADEIVDDPTIRRCIRFAKDSGFCGLYMLNLFAWRATDPEELYEATHPVGPKNDEALTYYRSRVGRVVAAWGACSTGMVADRAKHVADITAGPLWCLGRTKNGSPRHPLYVRADARWEIFEPETQTA